MKHNGNQALLASHLYELMPETERQQQLLPRVAIQLDCQLKISLTTVIRKGSRPRLVSRVFSYSTDAISKSVQLFKKVQRQSKMEPDPRHRKIKMALMEVCGYDLERSPGSVDRDLSLLFRMSQMANRLDMGSIRRSLKAQSTPDVRDKYPI